MKKSRHGKILEIIKKHDIETQEELAQSLRDAGFNVTQATVSRDIRELHLSKVPTAVGGQKYVALKREDKSANEKFVRVLRDSFASVEKAQNLVVLKTVAGMAMAAAAALDNLSFKEIVGCIAGDDTIFAATHTTEEAASVVNKIHEMVNK